MWVGMLHKKVFICHTYLRPLFSVHVNTASYVSPSMDIIRGTFPQASTVGSKGKLPETWR